MIELILSTFKPRTVIMAQFSKFCLALTCVPVLISVGCGQVHLHLVQLVLEVLAAQKHKERQTERQTDRQTDRQIDR